MEINVIIDEDIDEFLEISWLQGVAGQVLTAEGADPTSELGLVIVGQEMVQQLNLTYLGRDEPTDVLAFSMLPGPSTEEETGSPHFVPPPDSISHLGEVIISYPQAVIQANERRYPVRKEISILIIHGILHLLGYDHDLPEPEQLMRTREAEILKIIEEEGY